MRTVKEILQSKGNSILTVSQDQTVYEALVKMAEADVGALVVVNGNDEPVGLFSERDYARKVILKGASSLNTQVKTVMTDKVCYVSPAQPVDECMALVTEERCRHLPVMDEGRMVGLVSIGDLVKTTISEKEFLITQLSNYIQSG
ncbi:MAG: CBS domain-containing protein [Proteobacteria bacterium]|nr:CBS domain-containing protein [Pseudomonadota bacterium]